MALTIDVEDESGISIADATVTVEAANIVSFAVEGILRLGSDVLTPFVGARLTPAEVAFAIDGERVAIDLTGDPELQLNAVDVGIEMLDDAASDPVEAATDPTDAARETGRISFTLEGVVGDVPEDAAERLEGADAAPGSVTFSVDDATATDGGDAEAPMAAIDLVAIRIAVLVDGTIVVTPPDTEVP